MEKRRSLGDLKEESLTYDWRKGEEYTVMLALSGDISMLGGRGSRMKNLFTSCCVYSCLKQYNL